MNHRIAPPSARPPVAIGCAAMLAVLALLAGFAVFAASYLESGSDTGKLTLDRAAAYAAGTFTFEPEHNLYLVRLTDRRFFALSDLDAANRGAAGRRCRAAPLSPASPAFAEAVARYQTSASPAAAGLALYFAEECNGATYDAAGVRLDQNGRNLDRHEVDIDASGRVVVNLASRVCTSRDGASFVVEVEC